MDAIHSNGKLFIATAGLSLALLGAYSNHFENGFHFDDLHSIVENPAIRNAANIPRFFVDVTTFSRLPAGQSYRPLVSTSLAIDYRLAQGFHPFWFHVSTFFWFLLQLVLMIAMYRTILSRAGSDRINPWAAWFAAALYALHPVSAETVNYIIQRGDVYVALGIVAGLLIYARNPASRRYGIYLLPPLAAMFSKPTALVFAPLLTAYILLVDRGKDESVRSCLLRAFPAIGLTAAFGALEKIVTPPAFYRTSLSSFDYWITQPYVTLRYFCSFFLPLHLNVDSDLPAFHSLATGRAIFGILFCAMLAGAAVFSARKSDWRPVSLGIWWFFIALVPTAAYPLAEVENDHRMFLPFIGLSLAVVSAIVLLEQKYAHRTIPALAAAGIVALLALSIGTYDRNQVWRTDESLWSDDIEKSPNNPRGHNNLGATLSAQPGRLSEAIAQYRIALRLKPDYAEAHVNLGKAFVQIGHSSDAIHEYECALRIDPNNAEAHVNLGASLAGVRGRESEVIPQFEAALKLDPNLVLAHYDLGVLLSQIPGRLDDAIGELQEAAQVDPSFVKAHLKLGIAYASVPGHLPDAIREFETVLKLAPNSPEAHRNLARARANLRRLQEPSPSGP